HCGRIDAGAIRMKRGLEEWIGHAPPRGRESGSQREGPDGSQASRESERWHETPRLRIGAQPRGIAVSGAVKVYTRLEGACLWRGKPGLRPSYRSASARPPARDRSSDPPGAP